MPSRGNNYIALIGDLVRSRQAEKRSALQHTLGDALTTINRKFAPSVAARFVVTIGDEFQGLLRNGRHVGPILGQLWADLHPTDVRFGIGVGSLATELLDEAIGMDGPCFHRARGALTQATRDDSFVEVETGANVEAFRIFGALFGIVRRRWTVRQRQVFNLKLSGLSGKDIAGKLGIKPSAVSQHLQAADSKKVLSAVDLWHKALQASMRQEPAS